MTPCQKLGYKVGDKFVFKNTSGFEVFPTGTIITLFEDDGDDCPLFKGAPCKYNHAGGQPGAYVDLSDVTKVGDKVKVGDTIEFKITSHSLRAYGYKEYPLLLLLGTLSGKVVAVSKNGNPTVALSTERGKWTFRLGHGDFWLTENAPVQELPKVFDTDILNEASVKLREVVKEGTEVTWSVCIKDGETIPKDTICHAFMYRSVDQLLNYPTLPSGDNLTKAMRSLKKTGDIEELLESKDADDKLYVRWTRFLFEDDYFGIFKNPSYEHAMLHGWHTDLSKPMPIVMTALIMSRRFREFPNSIKLWEMLVDSGVHPRAAIVLSEFVLEPGLKPSVRNSGHQAFDVFQMTLSDIVDLVKGAAPKETRSYLELGTYTDVNGSFCHSKGRGIGYYMQDCFDKDVTEGPFGNVKAFKLPPGGVQELSQRVVSMFKSELVKMGFQNEE